MKVLIFGSSAHLTFNITRLAIALKKTGLDVTVMSTKNEEQPGLVVELFNNSIRWYEIKPVDKIFSLNWFSVLFKLMQILKYERWDVIHSNCFRHLILSYFACKFLKCKNTKLFVTIHTTFHGTKLEELVLKIEKVILLLTKAKAIAVANDTRIKLIQVGVSPQKVVAIPNGIDLEYLDKAISTNHSYIKNSSYLNIVNVGALIPRKGQEYLIYVAKLCKEHNVPVIVRIVGEGFLRPTLMNMIKKYQLEDRVFLLGRILEYSKLYQILSESDIFVFPTKAELLPFAVLEAMAVGKPVIATNVGGIKEIIVDHVNGILVDALEEKDLSKYIFYSLLELYENEQLRLKIGESARKTIEEKFSLQVIANKLKNEYENTLLRK